MQDATRPQRKVNLDFLGERRKHWSLFLTDMAISTWYTEYGIRGRNCREMSKDVKIQ